MTRMPSKTPKPSIELELQNASGGRAVPSRRQFAAWAAAALEGQGAVSLAVRLVGVEEMRDLNARYRGRDTATNVLSFPVDIPKAAAAGLDHRPLGDVVICAPVVESEAQEQGKEPAAHWAHLAIHGILHLLGHDHQREQEARAMESIEIRCLASFGFPNPYQ